jgi:hypothetical protein
MNPHAFPRSSPFFGPNATSITGIPKIVALDR